MGYEFQERDLLGLAEKLGAETRRKGDELFFTWCPYCRGTATTRTPFP